MAERNLALILKGRNEISKPAQEASGALSKLGQMAGSVTDTLGRIGLAAGGLSALVEGAKGAANAFGFGLNMELENTRAQLIAFTKDGAQAEAILEQIRKEASTTPFAFKEMAAATAGLMPVAKQSGVALMDLVKQAEILAASNPAQGLEGAAFALREAVGGDFTSIIERFNLPRQTINKLKEEGVPALQAVQMAMKEMGFDADLVSGLANTASGRWSTFMDTIDTLRATVSKPLFERLSGGLAGLQGFLDANMEMFGKWADTAGASIGIVFDTIQSLVTGKGFDVLYDSMIKVWRPGAAATLAAFIDPLAKVREALGGAARAFEALQSFGASTFQALTASVGIFTQWLVGHVQKQGSILADRLTEWGKAFVEWVAPMIPPLLSELLYLAGKALDWILEQRTEFQRKLLTWADAFIAWVGPLIPPLIDELLKMAGKMLNWVSAQVPKIIDAVGTWATEFTAWVGPKIPVLLAEAGKLASKLLDWIIAQGPPLAEKFLSEWVPAAIGWVAKAAFNLLKELPSIITTIGNWIINEGVPKLIDLGAKMGKAIVDGLIGMVKNLGGQIYGAVSSALPGGGGAGQEGDIRPFLTGSFATNPGRPALPGAPVYADDWAKKMSAIWNSDASWLDKMKATNEQENMRIGRQWGERLAAMRSQSDIDVSLVAAQTRRANFRLASEAMERDLLGRTMGAADLFRNGSSLDAAAEKFGIMTGRLIDWLEKSGVLTRQWDREGNEIALYVDGRELARTTGPTLKSGQGIVRVGAG